MTPSRRNASPAPSTSSILSNDSASLEEIDIRSFVKVGLLKRLFLGHYQERRYVDMLHVYRDLVVLHKSETEFQTDIDRILSKLNSFYGGAKWLGITGPETIGAPAASHCIWTNLQDVAFGFYWFQIRKICFKEHEVFVCLKVIRSVDENLAAATISDSLLKCFSENISSLKSCIQGTKEETAPLSSGSPPCREFLGKDISRSTSVKNTVDDQNPLPDSAIDPCTVLTEKRKFHVMDLFTVSTALISQFKEYVIILVGLGVNLFNILGNSIEFVGLYSLKFLHEISFLIRSLTPILIAVIDLLGKIVGGLYILVAMIVRAAKSPPPPPRPLPSHRAPPQPYRQIVTPDMQGQILYNRSKGFRVLCVQE